MQIEADLLFGEVPCPGCGQLLWFIRLATEVLVYPKNSDLVADRFLDALSRGTGIAKTLIAPGMPFEQLSLDSLEVAELVLEFEDLSDSGDG